MFAFNFKPTTKLKIVIQLTQSVLWFNQNLHIINNFFRQIKTRLNFFFLKKGCVSLLLSLFLKIIYYLFLVMLPLISFIGRYWKWIQDKVYSLYANFWQTAENCRQVHAFVVKLRHLSLRNCWNLVHLSLHKINHTFSQISIKSVKLRHLSLRNCWNLVHLSLHKINHTFSQISIKSGGQRMVIWKLPTIPSGVVVCTSVFFFPHQTLSKQL